MSSPATHNVPVSAPFNPATYNQFRKSILNISDKYWIGIDHGQILILPPEGESLHDRDPVLKCMTAFCSRLSLAAESDRHYCTKLKTPMVPVEQATAEWAFLNGAEGRRLEQYESQMMRFARRYPEWMAEHENDPGEFDEHDR